MLVELEFEHVLFFYVGQRLYQFVEIFNPNELEDSSQDCLNVDIDIRDLLITMRATKNSFFKNIKYFAWKVWWVVCSCVLINLFSCAFNKHWLYFGQPSIYTYFRTTVVQFRHIYETWQCVHIWWIPMELVSYCIEQWLLFVILYVNYVFTNELTKSDDNACVRLGCIN